MFDVIPGLLESPYTFLDTKELYTGYFWPSEFLKDPKNWTSEEINTLRKFATDEQIKKYQKGGHYSGYRMTITPDGKWMLVAHQNSSTVAAFRVDAATGRLTPTGPPSRIATPVCLKM